MSEPAQPYYSLPLREAIRKRPGMYIGSVSSKGLHVMVSNFIDLAVDEALAGFGNFVEIILNADGSFIIKNNSYSLPVEEYGDSKTSILELLMTRAPYQFQVNQYDHPQLGKVIKIAGEGYWITTIANCLSEWAWVEVYNPEEGRVYRQDYLQGEAQGPVRVINQPDQSAITDFDRNWTNTFCFKPDPQIFEDTEFNYAALVSFAQRTAYLKSGLGFHLLDRRNPELPQQNTFYYKNGLISYLQDLNTFSDIGSAFYFANADALHSPIYAAGTYQQVQVEVALVYRERSQPKLFCFVNNNATELNHMPVEGFKAALQRRLNQYGRQAGILKPEQPNLTKKQLLTGINAVINIRLPEPQWQGPTKNVGIYNPEARRAVRTIFGRSLQEWLAAHPAEAERVLRNILAFVHW